MKKVLLIVAALFLSTGCSSKTKKKLGLTETIPDEYQVKRNKSLEIPPHYAAKESAGKTEKGKKKDDKLSKGEEALLKDIE